MLNESERYRVTTHGLKHNRNKTTSILTFKITVLANILRTGETFMFLIPRRFDSFDHL
jgi:hypothetical protein